MAVRDMGQADAAREGGRRHSARWRPDRPTARRELRPGADERLCARRHHRPGQADAGPRRMGGRRRRPGAAPGGQGVYRRRISAARPLWALHLPGLSGAAEAIARTCRHGPGARGAGHIGHLELAEPVYGACDAGVDCAGPCVRGPALANARDHRRREGQRQIKPAAADDRPVRRLAAGGQQRDRGGPAAGDAGPRAASVCRRVRGRQQAREEGGRGGADAAEQQRRQGAEGRRQPCGAQLYRALCGHGEQHCARAPAAAGRKPVCAPETAGPHRQRPAAGPEPQEAGADRPEAVAANGGRVAALGADLCQLCRGDGAAAWL